MHNVSILNRMNLLNSIDPMVSNVIEAIGSSFDVVESNLNQITNDMYFDTCSENMLEFYEAEADITPAASQSIDDRRSTLIAKWRSNGKSDLELLRVTADAWHNGKVNVDFTNGVIEVSFVDKGVPADLATLKAALEEVAPAHLPFNYAIEYNTWNDVSSRTWNNVSALTWEEMRID